VSSSHAQQGRTHAPQAFQRCLDVCSLQQRPRQRWQQGGQSGAVCNFLNALEVVLQVRLRVLQQGTGGEGMGGGGRARHPSASAAWAHGSRQLSNACPLLAHSCLLPLLSHLLTGACSALRVNQHPASPAPVCAAAGAGSRGLALVWAIFCIPPLVDSISRRCSRCTCRSRGQDAASAPAGKDYKGRRRVRKGSAAVGQRAGREAGPVPTLHAGGALRPTHLLQLSIIVLLPARGLPTLAAACAEWRNPE
jgi:hypothetical protein